jgi:uncharacterized membrane protein YccC
MSSKNKSPLKWLLQQFQLKPGKPAIVYGLRTLVVLIAPIGVGILVGHPGASVVAVLAAMFVGMADVGGAYRQKATAMTAATIGVTVALLIGSLVGSNLWLTIPTTFIVIFIAGLAGLYGSTAATVSLVTSIMFVVSVAKFGSSHNLSTILLQCSLCLAGGVWAMVMSLGLWVLRPYAPVMEAVASCYLTLSKFIESASETRLTLEEQKKWAKDFLESQDTVTQALISTREIWSAVWTGQDAVNLRGNQLLVLIEDASQIFNSIVALLELLVIASDRSRFHQLQREIQQAIEQLAIALQMLSKAIAKDKKNVYFGDLDRAIEALEHQWQLLRTQVIDRGINFQTDEYLHLANINKIVANLKALAQQLRNDAIIVTDLQRGEAASIAKLNISQRTLPKRSSIVETLRNNLTFGSVTFRHALRLALVTTVAELLSSLLKIPTGYWVTLTAVVALKPNFGGTSQTTVQRILGTVLGGIIGITLVVLIQNQLVITVCLLLLIVAAWSMRPLSYTIFVTLLTPIVILIINMTGAGGWNIGLLRIVDSLAGGGLALFGSYLLFPRWERHQLPAQLSKTIRANIAYFQQVITNYLNPGHDASINTIGMLAHQAALENANAAAAAQRLCDDPRHVRGEIEPVMTLMLYIRGFFSSVTTLAEHHREFHTEYQVTNLQPFADTIVQVLENLASSLDQGLPPQSLPVLSIYLEAIHNHIQQLHTARISELTKNLRQVTPTLQAVREQTPVSTQLDRIAHEVTIMHCAIVRLQKGLDY